MEAHVLTQSAPFTVVENFVISGAKPGEKLMFGNAVHVVGGDGATNIQPCVVPDVGVLSSRDLRLQVVPSMTAATQAVFCPHWRAQSWGPVVGDEAIVFPG
ncbi:hypothetical protein HDU99_009583, partial [Rhizoclosmatium hyalinum]